MLNSIQIVEMYVQAKRDDIERAAERQRLVREAPEAGRCLHPRRMIAAGLVRLAMLIDESAGWRFAATAAR